MARAVSLAGFSRPHWGSVKSFALKPASNSDRSRWRPIKSLRLRNLNAAYPRRHSSSAPPPSD
jgi:hypothetical protein